jgi:GR25 family glycosyltransferase involved in LPS biosynthesis
MQLSSFYSKIYIIHWKPLKERKEYLVSMFKHFGIDDLVEWVDQYETEKDLINFQNPFNINKKILAINHSHIYCYKQQIQNNYKNILILEDDIDFETINLPLYLNQCADEFVELDGDIAFLSSCCGIKIENPTPPKLLYYNQSYVTRCMGAYITYIRCAEKLISLVNTNFHAIDRILNYILPHVDIRVLWSSVILKQGSETGKYKSSLMEIRDKFGNYVN